MKVTEKFGSYQGTCLILVMVCAKIFLTIPQFIARSAGPAGWLLILCKFLFFAFLLFFLLFLYRPYCKEDLITLSGSVFGSFGRSVCGILIFSYFISSAALTLRLFADGLKRIAFPDSPMIFILVFFASVMLIAAYMGTENQSRLASLFLPIILAVSIVVFLILSQYFNTDNLAPVLGTGINTILKEGAFGINFIWEFIILFLIAPNLHDFKTTKKTLFVALLFAFLIYTAFQIVYLCLVPYPAATDFYMPLYQISRLIKGESLWRLLEKMFLFLWLLGIFMYLGTSLYFSAKAWKGAFDLKHGSPMLPMLTIIIISVSQMPATEALAALLYEKFLKSSFIILPLLPLVVLTGARIKGGRA